MIHNNFDLAELLNKYTETLTEENYSEIAKDIRRGGLLLKKRWLDFVCDISILHDKSILNYAIFLTYLQLNHDYLIITSKNL